MASLTCHFKFTPTLRKSAFGGSFADWIITFPRDYDAVDPASLLPAAALAMKDTIKNSMIEHNRRLKYTMSIHVVFKKATDPEIKTDPPVVLTTGVNAVFLDHNDLDSRAAMDSEELFEMIQEY